MTVKEYKCQNCGGAVTYDGKSRNLVCAHCESAFDVTIFDAHKKELDVSSNNQANVVTDNADNVGGAWDDMDAGGLETGACPSCGAELFGCKNAVAVVCPHCGNAEIAVKRLSGILKPDYVIPFKLKKKSAVAALKRFCKDKYLLPKDYFDEKRINGMQGVYVPFWLFDIKRSGSAVFEKIPADGSRRMDDDYMDAIEPFYYGGMKVFDPAYLAGYLADRYDVSSQECKERVKKRAEGTLGVPVSVKETKESYALFPVWIFNAKYGGENYKFIVNGQTGSLAGQLPTDKGRIKKYMTILTGAYGALFTSIALAILRSSVVGLLLDGDPFGSDFTQTILLTPLGYLVKLLTAIKIPILLALWCPAYLLARGILKKWKTRMNTVALKTEAGDYLVKG